jgi:hypothetical protein
MNDDERGANTLRIAGGTFIVGVFGTLVLALQLESEQPAQPTMQRGEHHALTGMPERVATMPDSPETLREMLSARVRVAPDRRLSLAIGESFALRGGARPVVSVERSGQRWSVVVDGRSRATLRDWPTFDALFEALTTATRELPLGTTTGAAPEAATWPVLTPSRATTTTLAALDRAWASGARNAHTVAAAARALTALAIETPDTLDAADLLCARALAALAWARALDRRDRTSEALLAYHMGYESDAARLAEGLPMSSAVRHWVTGDDAQLREIANAREATEADRYLWFRRLVARGDRVGALTWVETHHPAERALVPIGGFLLRAYRGNPIDEYRSLVRAQPERMVAALERERGLEGALLGNATTLLPRLAGLDARFSGGLFVDRTLAELRARAVVLSAFDDEVDFMLHVWNVPRLTADYLRQLSATTPPEYRDFTIWAQNLADAALGNVHSAVLNRDLGTRTWLGAPALLKTWNALAENTARLSVEQRLGAENLRAHLDTRPAHRAAWSAVLGDALCDLPREAPVCESLLRDAPHLNELATVRCYKEVDDREALANVARSERFETAPRVYAAQALLAHDEASGLVALRAAVREGDEHFTAFDAYTRWLVAHERGDEARPLIEAWLRAHDNDAGLHPIVVRARLARILRLRRNYAAAWRLVAPDVSSLAGPPMVEGALALIELRRYDEAERIARDYLARYQSGAQVALLAEVLWHKGDVDAAGDMITRNLNMIENSAWSEYIAESFARVFAGRDVATARAAFAPIANLTGEHYLSLALPQRMAAQGRHEHAAELYALMQPVGGNPVHADDLLVRQFLMRVRASGPDAAMTWARSAFDAARCEPLSMLAYPAGADVLLWQPCPLSAQVDDREFVWLMRAAATLRAGPADPHRAAVMEHYRSAPAHDYAVMGRYLMGVGDRTSMMALARNERRRTEVAYYTGLRAMNDGNLTEASDWFQLVRLVGTWRDGEYEWARDTLLDWSNRMESPTVLAQHPWPLSLRPAAAVVANADAPAHESPRRHHRERRRHHREERHERHRDR